MKHKHAAKLQTHVTRHPQPGPAAPPPGVSVRRKLVIGAVVLGVCLGVGGISYACYLLWPRAGFNLFGQTKLPAPKLNPATPPGEAPAGMVWVPGGEFYMGIDPEQIPENCPPGLLQDAYQVHKIYVDGFWMDKHEVSNEDFAKFVKETGYVTVAEKKPDPKEFPNVPPEELAPFSIVFKKPEFKVRDPYAAHQHHVWWEPVKGASWKNPEGPSSNLKDKEKHPVLHIAYSDALEYCKWAKKRLPTEAEWEFAARGGLDRKIYVWGDELNPGGKWMCNNWQGDFPNANDEKDGFYGIAPVGSFPPNGYGLCDMVGNVWEWCHDFYQPKYYEISPEKNPKGPASGFDPLEQGVPKHVQRGGSFLCADNYCIRYLPGARGKGEANSGASHVGFRCVRDALQASGEK